MSAAEAEVAAVVSTVAPSRNTEIHSDSLKGDYFGLFGSPAVDQFQTVRLILADTADSQSH